MTVLSRLSHWRETGAITAEQHDAIAALVRKDRFSVFIELNALLYLGVLSVVAGLGWVIQEYLTSLGDAAILSGLTVVLILSFYYCFSRSLPYSSAQVESPTPAFDYVLYLACLVFALELAYAENRFHLLQDEWDVYLLLSSLLYFGLAYRFDNRFVLSLALSTLAGWFGLRISRLPFTYGDSLRPYALVYGLIVAAVGTWLHHSGIKRHFTETYFHIATNVLFMALVSGVISDERSWLYLLGLLGMTTIAIIEGVRFGRFSFVAYGTIYGYIGLSAQLLRDSQLDSTIALSYLIISGSLVILSMIMLARHLGHEE